MKKKTKYTPFKGKFIVGTGFTYGWDYVWSTDDEDHPNIPLVYDTEQQAEEAIQDDIESIRDAIKMKYMDKGSKTSRKDYIIATADMDSNGIVTVHHPVHGKTFDVAKQY